MHQSLIEALKYLWSEKRTGGNRIIALFALVSVLTMELTEITQSTENIKTLAPKVANHLRREGGKLGEMEEPG